MERTPTEITNKSIADLQKEGGTITDTTIRGFTARLLPSGKIQFGYRYGSRQQRGWITIGLLGEISVAQARRRAEMCAAQVSDHRFARHLRDLVHNLGDVSAGKIVDDERPHDGRIAVRLQKQRRKPRRVSRSQLYIRQHREASGLSLTELAKAIGKPKGLISQIENGRSDASLETLEDIAKFFGLAHVGMLFEPPVPKGWRRIMSIIPDNTLR